MKWRQQAIRGSHCSLIDPRSNKQTWNKNVWTYDDTKSRTQSIAPILSEKKKSHLDPHVKIRPKGLPHRRVRKPGQSSTRSHPRMAASYSRAVPEDDSMGRCACSDAWLGPHMLLPPRLRTPPASPPPLLPLARQRMRRPTLSVPDLGQLLPRRRPSASAVQLSLTGALDSSRQPAHWYAAPAAAPDQQLAVRFGSSLLLPHPVHLPNFSTRQCLGPTPAGYCLR